MSDAIATRPVIVDGEITALGEFDKALLANFAKDITDQTSRFDALAKILIGLNIAIPGFYAAILRLTLNPQISLLKSPLLWVAFVGWLLSLGLAMVSLIPSQYSIDPDNLTAVEHYYQHQAQRKWRLMTTAVFSSFFGICFAVFSLIL
jgi:hypothetical protein